MKRIVLVSLVAMWVFGGLTGVVAARNGSLHGEGGNDRPMASSTAGAIGSFRVHTSFHGGDFADGGRSPFGQ